MNNKICNPKVEVKEGIEMNDKDYLNSFLSCLKDMEKNYTIMLTEASNEKLYSIHKERFDKISDMQRRVFELAFRKGWYVLEQVDSNKIDEKNKLLNQEYGNLGI